MAYKRVLFICLLSGLSQALFGMQPAGNGEQLSPHQSLVQPRVDTPHPKKKKRKKASFSAEVQSPVESPSSPQVDKELSSFQLAAQGEVEKVKKYLDEHPDAINKFNSHGNTLLHCAIHGAVLAKVNNRPIPLERYKALFQLLIERKADIKLVSKKTRPHKPPPVSVLQLLQWPGHYREIKELFCKTLSVEKDVEEFVLLDDDKAQAQNSASKSSWVEQKLENGNNKENKAEQKTDLARSQFLGDQDLSASSSKNDCASPAHSIILSPSESTISKRRASVCQRLFQDPVPSTLKKPFVEKERPVAVNNPHLLAQSMVFPLIEQEDIPIVADILPGQIDARTNLYFKDRVDAERALGVPLPAAELLLPVDRQIHQDTSVPEIQAPHRMPVIQNDISASVDLSHVDVSKAVYFEDFEAARRAKFTQPENGVRNLDIPERLHRPVLEEQALIVQSNAFEVVRPIVPIQRPNEPVEVFASISLHPMVSKLVDARPSAVSESALPPAIVVSIIRQQAEQGAHAVQPIVPPVVPQMVHSEPLPEMPQGAPQRPHVLPTVSVQQEPVVDMQTSHIHDKDEASAGVEEPRPTPMQEASQGSRNLNLWSNRIGVVLGVGFAGIVFYKWLKQVQARARQKPIHGGV